MAVATRSFELAHLEAMLAEVDQISRDEADEILKWHFTEDEHQRVEELARANNNNRLAPSEWNELREWVEMANTLSLLKLKLRFRFGIPLPS